MRYTEPIQPPIKGVMTQKQLALQDDYALVLRTAGGDVRAFETIYDRHSAHVFRVAMCVTRRRRAAEEATQDVFLGLWRTARRYDPTRGTLRTWLACAVRNRSIDWLRGEARHDRVVEIDDSFLVGIEAADRTHDEAVQRDEAHTTRQLLTGLSDEQREVIELAYFGQLSQAEIAEAVGIPLGTVKGRQRLALKKLRESVN